VYKAEETALGRVVALKMLRAGLAAEPKLLERLHREAWAMAQLDHRHIIPIFAQGSVQGQPYFTMKWVAGGSLADHLARVRADSRLAVSLMVKVARAVHYLHEKRLFHRDLKPSNILLSEENEPFVSDFGLAKILDADLEMTRTGEVLGTVPYMAPE